MLMLVRTIPAKRMILVGTATARTNTARRCLSGIGRMLDLGGMPSGANDRTPVRAVNASKNSKLQAVAFDFEVLTRSIEASETNNSTAAAAEAASTANTTSTKPLGAVQPDLDLIHQVGSLLQVNVDTGKGKGEGATTNNNKKAPAPKVDMRHQDIRAKYAAKLKGGVPGLELAKSQVENSLQRGDAAGHLAARKNAISETAASPTKWMALTGTGKLLSYLTHRSIRIALLPNPKLDAAAQTKQTDAMEQFKRQLKNIVVDAVVTLGEDSTLSRSLETGVLKELDMQPGQVLIVSDQDHYLKAARDLGMLTCRIRPLSARRGNVTTHYSAASVPEVQEIVNEINGISFNAVLNR
jgi:hypothetical protein